MIIASLATTLLVHHQENAIWKFEMNAHYHCRKFLQNGIRNENVYSFCNFIAQKMHFKNTF